MGQLWQESVAVFKNECKINQFVADIKILGMQNWLFGTYLISNHTGDLSNS